MDTQFSIIIPCFNRGDIILKTLKSVMNQSFENFEIIIVDDGSTDNTEQIVMPYLNEKIKYIRKNNAERAAARNFGASIAKGLYINFFDSDDIALPNHLETAINLINMNPKVDWFHLGYAWADSEGKIFREVNQFKGDTLNAKIAFGNPLSCNSVFIRNEILVHYKFNEDQALSGSEDYELWCRLAARFPLFYSNTITSLVIDHENRSVRTIEGEKLINRLKLLIKYLEEDNVTMSFFGKKFTNIKMDANSYIALHLANNPKYKLKSIIYLVKSLINSTSLINNRRFYATIKNILVKW